MGAPSGNKFWLQRSSHGRKPIFSDPEKLWNMACEYFEWCYETPLYETKAFAYEGEVTTEELPKMRAMTIQGLCFFLDISDETWANYCKNKDFIGICNDIKRVIYTQKFEGASAGLLSASIIAREISLSNGDSSSSSKDSIDLEIRKLELEKLRREINPPKVDTPDEDYTISLTPDEEIPNEPIL